MKDKKIGARKREASGESLGRLRAEIRDITKSIFNLAKARQNLSERVALIKESKSLTVENRQIESKLIDAMQEYSANIGLDARLARHVTKDLVESSKSMQRRAIHFSKIKKHLSFHGVKQVGIVGAGRMGGWFASYFKPLVGRVVLFDSDRKFGKERARELGCDYSGSLTGVADSDLILVAVPMSEIIEVADLLLKQTKKKRTQTRILEISSIKERVIKGVGKRGPDLHHIHPLFGSSADYFADNCMIVVESRGRKEDAFVKGLFPHFKILNLNARDHDKLMTFELSLPHILALTFADIVSEMKGRSDISSPSYDSLLQLARKTLSENPKVYYEIQSQNMHNQEMLRKIKKSVAELEELVSSGDYERFAKFFSKTKKRLD